ncbi:MAG: RES family NAD+ phosphorylase [Opitutales bacterium]
MPSQIQPHKQYRLLRSKIARSAPDCLLNWEKPVYRAVDLKWAQAEKLLSGEGARLHGSRWMRKGITPVFYGASTESIAIKESRHNLRHFGIKTGRLEKKPRVLVQVHAWVASVVDVAALCRELPWPSLDEVLAENWDSMNAAGHETTAQAMGRALFELGYPALVTPSARDRRGRNLNLFPTLLRDGDLRVAHREELEKWLAP